MPGHDERESSSGGLHRAGRHRVAAHGAVDEMHVVGAGRRRREAGHHRGALAVRAVAHDALRSASHQMPVRFANVFDVIMYEYAKLIADRAIEERETLAPADRTPGDSDPTRNRLR